MQVKDHISVLSVRKRSIRRVLCRYMWWSTLETDLTDVNSAPRHFLKEAIFVHIFRYIYLSTVCTDDIPLEFFLCVFSLHCLLLVVIRRGCNCCRECTHRREEPSRSSVKSAVVCSENWAAWMLTWAASMPTIRYAACTRTLFTVCVVAAQPKQEQFVHVSQCHWVSHHSLVDC